MGVVVVATLVVAIVNVVAVGIAVAAIIISCRRLVFSD